MVWLFGWVFLISTLACLFASAIGPAIACGIISFLCFANSGY